MVSGRSFLPEAPFVWKKRMPAFSVMSLKHSVGGCTAAVRRAWAGPTGGTGGGAGTLLPQPEPKSAATSRAPRYNHEWRPKDLSLFMERGSSKSAPLVARRVNHNRL